MPLDPVFEYLGAQIGVVLRAAWIWFNALSREEWTIVLGTCCLAGFAIIRGLGKKHRV